MSNGKFYMDDTKVSLSHDLTARFICIWLWLKKKFHLRWISLIYVHWDLFKKKQLKIKEYQSFSQFQILVSVWELSQRFSVILNCWETKLYMKQMDNFFFKLRQENKAFFPTLLTIFAFIFFFGVILFYSRQHMTNNIFATGNSLVLKTKRWEIISLISIHPQIYSG